VRGQLVNWPISPSFGKISTVEVVGAKTHEALEVDWLAHFKAASPQGRPDGEGWLTAQEMADKAKSGERAISRYLILNESNYEKKPGTINSRKTTYYRFKVPSV
jgi:hypothetical protein